MLLVQHIIDALSLGCLYSLLAIGVALLFGVMRLINFAHGELIMVAAFVVVLAAPWGWVLAVTCGIAAAAAVALLMERVALRPIRGAPPVTLLITSFAVSALLQTTVLVSVGQVP